MLRIGLVFISCCIVDNVRVKAGSPLASLMSLYTVMGNCHYVQNLLHFRHAVERICHFD